MLQDPAEANAVDDFQDAVWGCAKVQGSDCCYSILAFNNLQTGCIFGRYLAQCRKGRYVVVHRHEALGKEIVYKRTGATVVLKAFTDKKVASKEADAVKWACGDMENISRLTPLIAQLQDHNTAYILFEFFEGGDLYHRICSMNGTPIPHPVAIQWMSDLLNCLKGLQRRGMAHMDLSSEVMSQVDWPFFLHLLRCSSPCIRR